MGRLIMLNKVLMRSTLLSSFVLILLISCSSPSVLMHHDDFRKIKRGAKEIVVLTAYTPDSLYKLLEISFSQKTKNYISIKDSLILKSSGEIGEEGIIHRTIARVKPNAKGSVAILKAEWRVDAKQVIINGEPVYRTVPVKFHGYGYHKGDIAFQYSYLIASSIPGGKIDYNF